MGCEPFDLADDLSNWSLEIARPCHRYHTEVALVRASAHRLHRIDGDVALFLQQVAPGFGNVGEAVARTLVIARLQLPCGEISQEARPRLLRVPDHDGIRVWLRLSSHQPPAYPPNYAPNSPFPK